MNLAEFKQITGFDSPRQYASVMDELGNQYAADKAPATAHDYKVMARLALAISVIDTAENWARVGEPIFGRPSVG